MGPSLAVVVVTHDSAAAIGTTLRALLPQLADGDELVVVDTASADATLDAVRDAGNRWVFRVQIDAGLEPWGGVSEVWAAGSPDARHGVDTTVTFDRGVASLVAHRAYIEGLGWEHFDPAEFLEDGARQAGVRLGVPKATTFEVFQMGWGA